MITAGLLGCTSVYILIALLGGVVHFCNIDVVACE